MRYQQIMSWLRSPTAVADQPGIACRCEGSGQ